MTKGKYYHRLVDKILKDKLDGIGAVLIEGPKLCGKTTTAEQIAGSVLYMASPDDREDNLRMAELKPSFLLDGKTPRLLDEWQIAPKLWDAVRYEVDHRNETGQFILTGSAVPADKEKIFHSGTGRISWLKMRPMSLYESEDSNACVSIKKLFDGELDISGKNLINNIEEIAYLVCRGGWPTALGQNKKNALNRATDYYDAVIHEDISRADGISRDSNRAARLMRSYARHQGTQISIAALTEDIKSSDTDRLNDETVASYISALKKIFVIEDMPSWNPNLRSKTAIRTAETRYFVDSSIAVAALGIGPGDLLNDLETFGLLFETMCIRDLRVYADSLGGRVFHYRDKTGLECDAVIHLKSGSYGLVEIKLGGESDIEHGAYTLKKLRDKIDTSKMNNPSFLMVLIGKGNYAYRRDDGVLVVPVTCLRD